MVGEEREEGWGTERKGPRYLKDWGREPAHRWDIRAADGWAGELRLVVSMFIGIDVSASTSVWWKEEVK